MLLLFINRSSVLSFGKEPKTSSFLAVKRSRKTPGVTLNPRIGYFINLLMVSAELAPQIYFEGSNSPRHSRKLNKIIIRGFAEAPNPYNINSNAK